MNGDFENKLKLFRKEMEEYVKTYGSKDGLRLKTAEDVLNFVKEKQIDSIRLWFTDALGFLKSFSLTPAELPTALTEGMGFDGSSVQGYARIQESDMVAFPIPETVQLIPFPIGGSKAIRMFAEIRTPEGQPYEQDPRNILKRNLAELQKLNVSKMFVGPEAEFFYFKNNKIPEVLDEAGYFDLDPVDAGDGLREATVFALESMGIPVEYQHHEVAPSQHEIDLKFQEALAMADNLQTYKWLVKEVARRNGIHATFMPKPLAGENGSGMHVHVSLSHEGKNLFYSPTSESHLSELAQKFMAGVLQYAPDICLITNQWSNSYKRLVPGFEAPVYIAWAERNRSALIRVPVYKPGKEMATRFELRNPDAACNPYLVFAAILGAGLVGIENNMALASPVNYDLYEMSLVERQRLGVKQLPHNLHDAAMTAHRSPLMSRVLGAQMLNKLVDTKLKEHTNHSLYVTQKEFKDYMKL
jgi:glutamine synthetase